MKAMVRIFSLEEGLSVDVNTISPQALREKQQSGKVASIDVRTPVEFRETHALDTRNVPLDKLRPRELMEARDDSQDDPLYVFCTSGNRARKAYQKFHDAGYNQVVVVEGGVKAWEQAGLPVTRGKKAMSLERQVRIAAGSLVLAGAVLALTVDYRFAALPAFVGAGLMFAGITDTCGMGMILARMPWNRVADCDAACNV